MAKWLGIIATVWMVAVPALHAQETFKSKDGKDALARPSVENAVRVAVLGDSLSSGYGIGQDKSFPAQLETILRLRGHNVIVMNAAIAGDTSGGGLLRLPWILKDTPDAVIVALGANDMLRGVEPQSVMINLDRIIKDIKAQNIRVMLIGMRAPGNYGEAYAGAFNRIYTELAKKHTIAFYPFFLEGVAGKAEFNLKDGIHPNEKGAEIMVRNMLSDIERLVTEIRATRG